MIDFLRKLFAALGIEVEAIEKITEEEAIRLLVARVNGEENPAAAAMAKASRVVIDDAQAAINRQLGVSEETFRKYNG